MQEFASLCCIQNTTTCKENSYYGYLIYNFNSSEVGMLGKTYTQTEYNDL